MTDEFVTTGETAIDVIAGVKGDTIVLALDSGDTTVTGFMRRRPFDWPSPAGSMNGSGWQVVCKASAIHSADLDTISGKVATINGEGYYIVAASLRDGGLVVLDIGYAST